MSRQEAEGRRQKAGRVSSQHSAVSNNCGLTFLTSWEGGFIPALLAVLWRPSSKAFHFFLDWRCETKSGDKSSFPTVRNGGRNLPWASTLPARFCELSVIFKCPPASLAPERPVSSVNHFLASQVGCDEISPSTVNKTEFQSSLYVGTATK